MSIRSISSDVSMEAFRLSIAGLQEQIVLLTADRDQLQNQVKLLRADNEELQQQVALLQTCLQSDDKKKYMDDLEQCSSQEIMDRIQELVKGSERMNMMALKEKAIEFALTVLDRKVELTVPILAACDDAFLALKDTEVESKALENVYSNPDLLVEASVLLSANRIESILVDPQMKQVADDYKLFCILQAWAQNAMDWARSAHETNVQEIQVIACSFLTNYIALENIPMTLLLSNNVRNSGLVTDAQLVEALAKQQASYNNSSSSSTTKQQSVSSFPTVWESTRTDLLLLMDEDEDQSLDSWRTDYVIGRAMKSGVHKWSIRVEEMKENYFQFGIASMSHKLHSERSLDKSNGAWSIYHDSKGIWTKFINPIIINKKDNNDNNKDTDNSNSSDNDQVIEGLPPLFKGCVVSFSLTLTENNHQNRLEVSINGGKFVTLFEGDMLIGDASGFVPAASVYSGNQIRFLGFEEE